MPGDHVDDRARDEERGNLARTGLEIVAVRRFDHRQTANARTDVHANALGAVARGFDACVLDRLNAGGKTVMNEGVHPSRVFRRQVGSDVEVSNFTGNLDRKVRDIEPGNLGNTGTAIDNVVPSLRNGIANGGYDSQARNYNSATCQCTLR